MENFHGLTIIYSGDGTHILLITLNIGKVLFISSPGSNTLEHHITNATIEPIKIAPSSETLGCALRGFNIQTTNLGISKIVQTALMFKAVTVEKVIICGHSCAGTVSYISHYDLIVNSSYRLDESQKEKIPSVAFGSPPFLECLRPNIKYASRFLTYNHKTDIVPSLFATLEEVADIL